jgi:hypothetical protein
MTKVWGPLGWATLHSIAAMYPDNPTPSERILLDRWMDSFKKTIVCEKCKGHFTKFLQEYPPSWKNSRKEFSLFVLRAHNAANTRTGKPSLSINDSLAALRRNVDPSRAHMQRQSYIMYIRNDWSRHNNMEGISALRYVKDLIDIESQYWSQQTFNWEDVEAVLNGESIATQEPRVIKPISAPTKSTGFSWSKSATSIPKLKFLAR